MTGFGLAMGASIGILTKGMANTLRKVPFLREPWEYPLYMAVGGYLGYHYMTWENKALAYVEKRKAEAAKQ